MSRFSGRIWHHTQYNPITGEGKMQLVPKSPHTGPHHTGAFSDYKNSSIYE